MCWCAFDLFVAFYLFCSTLLNDVINLVLQQSASIGKVRNGEGGRKYSQQTSERERANGWLDTVADHCQKVFAEVNERENREENQYRLMPLRCLVDSCILDFRK